METSGLGQAGQAQAQEVHAEPVDALAHQSPESPQTSQAQRPQQTPQTQQQQIPQTERVPQNGKRVFSSGSVRKPTPGKGPGRKPRACAECKKQKMKCEVLPGELRCRHCSRRDLACVMHEGVQREIQRTLVLSATPSTAASEKDDLDNLRREIQQLKASMTSLVRHGFPTAPDTPSALPMSHPSHPVHTISPAATALTLSTREDNTHMAMTRENSVEPATAADDTHASTAEDVAVDEPMGSLYEVTRLRNLRSSRAKTVRPPRNGPDDALDDFISKGVVSESEAEQLYATFHTSLNHYLWVGLEQTHPSFASVRKSSELLTATILTVTALHVPARSGTFDRCYAAFLSLISSFMF